MRLSTILIGAASIALAATPAAAAAVFGVGAGPSSSFPNQDCDGPGSFTGATTVSIRRTCTRADIGEATGEAVSSPGHLGARSVATSHSPILGAGIGAVGVFSDTVVFTSNNPLLTSADVSLNLLLDGVLQTGGPFDGAAVEGTASLGGVFDFFRFELAGGAFTAGRNDFSTAGLLGPVTHAVLTTGTAHVALNTPILVELRLQAETGVGGPTGFALSDFGDTLKFPATDVFNLPDGVTVNAGDYLVDNRFIDPLALPGGVPEPTAWAMLILGFGLAGSTLRTRRVAAYSPPRRPIGFAGRATMAPSRGPSTPPMVLVTR